MSAKRRRELDRAAVFEAILGDLSPAADGATPGASSRGSIDLPLDAIVYPEKQPRRFIDPVALATLTASVRERGVLEPVLVRPVAGGFELIAGERRSRAAREAGLSSVPAIVLELDDRDALEIAIMENLQREDLNAVEETEAVLQLLELSLALDRAGVLGLLGEMVQEARGRQPNARFEDDQKGVVAGLFERLGRFTVSSFLANRVPILNFPDELLEAVREGQLEFTKAQTLARLDEVGDRRTLMRETIRDGLSLSQIRRRITELRADKPAERRLDERVLERAQLARRLLQRRTLSQRSEPDLKRIERALDTLLELLDKA